MLKLKKKKDSMPVKGDLKQSEGYWNNFQAVKDSKCLNEDADEDEKSEDF